jgi:hypothetical protein
MSAILSFLGGSAFRFLVGEFSSWFTKRQDHKYELQRLKAQSDLDAAQHVRTMESQRLQAELGVKTIEVQSDADQDRIAAEAFREAMARSAVPTGIKWVDAWNASVRPAFASVTLFIWIRALAVQSWKPTEWDLNLMAAVAGYFFADRQLGKRGK